MMMQSSDLAGTGETPAEIKHWVESLQRCAVFKDSRKDMQVLVNAPRTLPGESTDGKEIRRR